MELVDPADSVRRCLGVAEVEGNESGCGLTINEEEGESAADEVEKPGVGDRCQKDEGNGNVPPPQALVQPGKGLGIETGKERRYPRADRRPSRPEIVIAGESDPLQQQAGHRQQSDQDQGKGAAGRTAQFHRLRPPAAPGSGG